MGKLIYSMIASLDGYVADASGDFSWGQPDEEFHQFLNDNYKDIGTYLYGRKIYELMTYWETAHELPGQPAVENEWGDIWVDAEKVVYSRTLAEPQSRRTRIERDFIPSAVVQIKSSSDRDITIAGPDLAVHALRAGLVDEVQVYVQPIVLGGGHQFFPEGIRLDLDLVEQRSFSCGVVWLRYKVLKTE